MRFVDGSISEMSSLSVRQFNPAIEILMIYMKLNTIQALSSLSKVILCDVVNTSST